MTAEVRLHAVNRPSNELLQRWMQKHADLLAQERRVEQEEARLLLSKCPPKQLERNGLAILGLGILSVSVGLGGKTLVELERPAAFHSSSIFPPHSLRPGDIVQIEDNSFDPSQGKQAKGKERNGDGDRGTRVGIAGVVFRASDTKLIVAASSGSHKNESKNDGLDISELPARVRVVKIANDATFDRMEWTLTKLAKTLNVSVKTAKRTYDASSSDEEVDAEGVQQDGGSAATPPRPASTLLPALLGITTPTWDAWPENEELQLYNPNLNVSQVAAVKFALSAQQFALIHGPPGTGKTTAVAEMVLQMALVRQKRVLVCGASNLAADNLLERIISKGGEDLKKSGVGVTRLGHPARVLQSLMTATLDYQAQNSSEGSLVKDVRRELEAALSSMRPKEAAGNKSTSSRGQASSKSQRLRGNERKERREEIKALRKEFRKRERGLVRTVLKRASIVVATCHGAGGRQLNGFDFDVVVIDEACQATEVACWVPIMKASPNGKVILAGDHLQLPPTVKSYRHSQHRMREPRGSRQADEQQPKEQVEEDSHSDEEEEEERYEARKESRQTSLRPPRSLETTLFSRLLGMYGQGCKALLDTQYRMNQEIMSFPNEALYQGKIKADESCAKIRLRDLESFHAATKTSQSGEGEEEADDAPIVFYDTAGCEMYESQQSLHSDGDGSRKASLALLDSRANAHEVELVAQHVQLLVQRGLPPDRISVLSPYNLQVSALADRLRGSGSGNAGDKNRISLESIVVGSIDSMQGMENDVVILSLVRSNDQRSVGFLAEHRRLNVAMTRAKRQLCIVGDSETISSAGDEYLKRWMTFLEEHALIEPVIV